MAKVVVFGTGSFAECAQALAPLIDWSPAEALTDAQEDEAAAYENWDTPFPHPFQLREELLPVHDGPFGVAFEPVTEDAADLLRRAVGQHRLAVGRAVQRHSTTQLDHGAEQRPPGLQAGAVDVRLTAAELARIDAIAPKGVAAGTRYPEAGMQTVNR